MSKQEANPKTINENIMKQIVITWGLDKQDGTPYLDCYLEITDCAKDASDINKDASDIKMMDLRGRFQNTGLATFKIPKNCNREDLSNYISSNTKDVMSFLKKNSVGLKDIVRKGERHQSLDFIKF